MNRIAWLFIVPFIVSRVGFADDAKIQNEATDLFARAAIRQGIRRSGERPYILKIQFSAEHIVPKPVDGQYQELWMSPDRWRRDFVLSGFKQVEIGSTASNWVSRNLDFSPRPAYLLNIALDAFVDPKIMVEEKVTDIRRKKSKGGQLRCVELAKESAPSKRELCFDESGALVSEELSQQRFEYGNFTAYDGKIFPRSILVYADDRKVLDLAAEGLVPPAEPKPELFQPEPGALQFAPCERWLAVPAKKVPPRYPREARDARQKGTVTAYAVVGADGRVEKTKVLESAGEALDQATLDAIQQWTFPAVNCGAQPLPTEIEIRVNYALSFQ